MSNTINIFSSKWKQLGWTFERNNDLTKHYLRFFKNSKSNLYYTHISLYSNISPGAVLEFPELNRNLYYNSI